MDVLLLLIFAITCFTVQPIQTTTTDPDSRSDWLIKLLTIHRQHCGDTATCGSREHVEPSEFVIPVPCCLPCSCLQSCAEQQNCCPVSVSGIPGVPIPTSGLSGIGMGNETNWVNHKLTDDGKTGISRSTTNENGTETREVNRLNKTQDTENTTQDSGVSIERENEICTRPQTFYRPNKYMDSQAYMMTVACPDAFEDKLIVDKCNAGVDVDEMLDMVPVTSKLTRLTYKNKYCLICNEKLQSEVIIDWKTEIVSNGPSYEHIFFASPDSILDTLINNDNFFTNIHFIPGDESLARRCNAFDIFDCNQTGLWDRYDQSMENLCLYGAQLPIISKVNEQPLSFRNIGCLYCNIETDSIENQLSCDYYKRKLDSALTFRTRLNSQNVFSNGKDEWPMTPATYIEQDALQRIPHRHCPAGKFYTLGRCRRIVCPRDHYTVHNQCVPLYESLEGLDLNIKIEIIPSRAIPRGISEAFADNLKNMADGTLSDTVSLEQRQVSLWYLPRSYDIPAEYYVLDIFLFNSSSIIEYSVAVEQFKRFFLKIKIRANLAVLVPLNIKLNFQLNHGLDLIGRKYIDMNNGVELKPLMGERWKMVTPRPYLTISEVNWCLRAVFDISEIVRTTRSRIVVKSTGTVLFGDQYDRQGDEIYMCVDLITNQTRVIDDITIVKDEKDAINNNSDVTNEKNVDPVRGLILTGSVIAAILLLVICYRVKIGKAKRQVQESNRSNKQPPDDIELNDIRK